MTERAQIRNPNGRRSFDCEPAGANVEGRAVPELTHLRPTVQSPHPKKLEVGAAGTCLPDGWSEDRLAILRVVVRALAKAEIREQIKRAGSRSKRA